MKLRAILFAACLCGVAHASALDAGKLALRGDPRGWPQAFAQFHAEAEAGNPAAAYYLGLMARNGMGTARDSALAAHWMTVAARGRIAAAMFTLSQMLQAGEGVAKDEGAAAQWLRAAAELDYPAALQQMALAEPDPARAAQLMKEAAHALKHRPPEP
jgi:TPR repeat protein